MWLIIGLIVGVGVFMLLLRLRNRSIVVSWYEWLIGAVGLLLIVGAIQHYMGSLVEGFPEPGLMGALAFGLPGLILLAVTWQLIARRQRAG